MMRKVFVITAAFLLHTIILSAQEDSIQARIIIIGDAGSFKKNANGKNWHPVVDAVKKTIPIDEKTTILYVGDNLYYTGLPDDAMRTYDVRRQVLDTQIDIALHTKAKVYFIPGNHDWNKMQPGGWEAIEREQEYIDREGAGKNVQFFPKGGCPGPVEVDVNDQVVMILMDSQWWLHLYEKPGIESDCGAKTKEEVVSQIDDIVSHNSGKLILFACHHPFKSYGIHGGYYTWKQHIFPLTEIKPNLYIPLPIVGSIYPITRSVFGTTQDLPHPEYQNMITDIQAVLKKYSNVIYVAGHEHNLQLIKDSSSYYVISGAGTNKTRVSHDSKHLLYGIQQYGFVVLNVSKNKYVNFNYYTVYGDSVVHAYDSTLVSFKELKKESVDSTKSVATAPFKDSVIAMVYPHYDSARGLHRFLLGDNYRSEWATPVHLKTFDINKTNGGYTIKSFGGGKETATLRLVSKKTGEQYALRTINKNPDKIIPEKLRRSIAEDIVKDMISASHPFAPLAIPDLESAVNVPAAVPDFYYLPNEPALGLYNPTFSKQVISIERRNPTVNTYSDTDTDTKSTYKIIDKLFNDNDNRIDEKEVLRARLIDMLIGDFDRHFDQWRWGTTDTGKGKLYYTIPRDRDQAFFYSNGFITQLASLELFPFLKGFKYNIRSINWLNYSARDFDRIFLNKLSESDWKQTIHFVQQKITDSVITTAINRMPPSIVAKDSATLINKLKSRRNDLSQKALEYYKFISKTVTVVGSNDNEFFNLSAGNGDSLLLNVYKRKKKTRDTSSLMYSRVFDPHVTKEIRLYGLNGNDIFYVDSQLTSRIKVRMIGGKGNDTFNIHGSVRNYIYDLNTEKNFIVRSNRTRNKTSPDPNVNEYSATQFKYNTTRFPSLNLAYNPDDKFLAGIGFLWRTYGFRNDPATVQKLSTLDAFNTNAYQIKYYGEFNHVFNKNDLLINFAFVDPTLNNFFGLGNETKIDPTKDLDYYKTRYRYTQADVLFRKRFNSVLSVMAGPTLYHYWNEYSDNSNKILSKPSDVGLDSINVYSKKTYLGGKVSILVNNLDNVLLPTRGIDWVTQFTSMAGLGNSSKAYTAFTSDMAVHGALTDPAKVVAVLKLGGGHIFSKNYEYFQAMDLGANNFLRGFRKDRFAGTSDLYASLELRLKLFTSTSYVLPGDVGIIGFNDVGRVWLKGESSEKWHDAYGGGIYFAAYNYALLSATVGFSKEEHVFNFSLGTKFNITF